MPPWGWRRRAAARRPFAQAPDAFGQNPPPHAGTRFSASRGERALGLPAWSILTRRQGGRSARPHRRFRRREQHGAGPSTSTPARNTKVPRGFPTGVTKEGFSLSRHPRGEGKVEGTISWAGVSQAPQIDRAHVRPNSARPLEQGRPPAIAAVFRLADSGPRRVEERISLGPPADHAFFSNTARRQAGPARGSRSSSTVGPARNAGSRRSSPTATARRTRRSSKEPGALGAGPFTSLVFALAGVIFPRRRPLVLADPPFSRSWCRCAFFPSRTRRRIITLRLLVSPLRIHYLSRGAEGFYTPARSRASRPTAGAFREHDPPQPRLSAGPYWFPRNQARPLHHGGRGGPVVGIRSRSRKAGETRPFPRATSARRQRRPPSTKATVPVGSVYSVPFCGPLTATVRPEIRLPHDGGLAPRPPPSDVLFPIRRALRRAPSMTARPAGQFPAAPCPPHWVSQPSNLHHRPRAARSGAAKQPAEPRSPPVPAGPRIAPLPPLAQTHLPPPVIRARVALPFGSKTPPSARRACPRGPLI